jgi:hypothetical protein
MSSFTDYTENLVLNYLLTAGSVTRPTAWYVGLFTSAPSDTGGGTEVTGNGYERISASFSVSGTNPTVATNSAAIEFPVDITANWGTITHVALFTASTSGTMLAWAALTTSKTIEVGDILRIPTGDLDISLT